MAKSLAISATCCVISSLENSMYTLFFQGIVFIVLQTTNHRPVFKRTRQQPDGYCLVTLGKQSLSERIPKQVFIYVKVINFYQKLTFVSILPRACPAKRKRPA
jgi:hypothetical protein